MDVSSILSIILHPPSYNVKNMCLVFIMQTSTSLFTSLLVYLYSLLFWIKVHCFTVQFLCLNEIFIVCACLSICATVLATFGNDRFVRHVDKSVVYADWTDL